MAFGTVWHLPSGHIGVELSRAGGWLTIARIVPGWPWPAPPREYIAELCSPADGVAVSYKVLEMLREVAAC